MSEQAFKQMVCWRPERIGIVINKEALSVARADFLATHVTMRDIAYTRAPRTIHSTDELDLLDELERMADSDLHTFVIVRGAPGTGKSHLIRWLKERYAAIHRGDAVLLIERANTSLRGTLQQIVSSGVFDTAGVPDALQRLQEAITILSADALADNLLDQVKTATKELTYADLPPRITPKRIEGFLLDEVIRDHLKRPGGPIDRVVRFLTEGREQPGGMDDTPGFEPEDFLFSIDLRRRLTGYMEVKSLAEDLSDRAQNRDKLAGYLNHLLRNYAISHATRLSAQDLRAMFMELRRHLRTLGKSLALFIEDITAFTGIDEGLIDVLITQHTGEGNAALCRMTSVVGMTDAFFSDFLPDNYKQRVTHELTLSAASRGGSDMLEQPGVRAELAARYMNAMRLTADQLEGWARAHPTDDALPIACDTCPVRTPCHESFGTVKLQAGGEQREIGLYPFNDRALYNFYAMLSDGYTRTPRTFLFDILAHLLTTYTDSIREGSFPPPEGELLPAVKPPTFNPPAHRSLIERQGDKAAPRLMTLLLFWGEANAFRRGDRLGGIPDAVFRALSVRRIEGTPDGTALTPPVPTAIPAIPTLPIAPAVDEPNPYITAIDAWARGAMLTRYEPLATWLAGAVRSFIDWQAHGIGRAQVENYITQGLFEIEGQSATNRRTHKLTFARNHALRDVLTALAVLNDKKRGLAPDQAGEYLVTLSDWLRLEEPRIVAWVRDPAGRASPAPDYLLNILTRCVVLTACLEGLLTPSASLTAHYHEVVASCRQAEPWEQAIKTRDALDYPKAWTDLMKQVNRGSQNSVKLCREALLSLLNRPQGDSKNVRYLDAAALITILDEFARDDWSLLDLPYKPDTSDETWNAALHMYQTLQAGFPAAVAACHDQIARLHSGVSEIMGDAAPRTMMSEWKKTLDKLRAIGVSYPPRLDEPHSTVKGVDTWTGDSLKALLTDAGAMLAKESLVERALAAGTSYPVIAPKLGKRYDLIRAFMQEIGKRRDGLREQIAALNEQEDAAEQHRRATVSYDTLTDLLTRTLGELS